MKIITLEIENEQDYEHILYLAQKFGLKFYEKSTFNKEMKNKEQQVKEMIQFYKDKGKSFENFKFNRQEANER